MGTLLRARSSVYRRRSKEEIATLTFFKIFCKISKLRGEVPRSRFAPVKKCSDLFLLRSDAYTVDEGQRPVLAPGVARAPTIDLDSKKYKMVSQLERCSP